MQITMANEANKKGVVASTQAGLEARARSTIHTQERGKEKIRNTCLLKRSSCESKFLLADWYYVMLVVEIYEK